MPALPIAEARRGGVGLPVAPLGDAGRRARWGWRSWSRAVLTRSIPVQRARALVQDGVEPALA
jgi:hypothetical protein